MPKVSVSISAPSGLHFGDTFTPTYTAPALKPGLLLWAMCVCTVDGTVVYRQELSLDGKVGGNVRPFTLGPTPSWSSGPAHGALQLYTTNQYGEKPRTLASATFEVAG
jgi:hypothetical protein